LTESIHAGRHESLLAGILVRDGDSMIVMEHGPRIREVDTMLA